MRAGSRAALVALLLAAACSGGGGGAPSVTKPDRAAHGKWFPIDGGPHGQAGCQDCHGGTETFAEFHCTSCHEHDEATAGAGHAAVAGYGFDSALCVRCHAEGQVTRMAAHLPFQVGPGTAHGTVGSAGDCLGCHPSLRTDKPWAEDFSRADCLGCHAQAQCDPAHRAVPGYAYATPTCLASACHADGTRPAYAGHEALFPIAAGTKHAAARCADCHADAANRAVLACAGCHPHVEPDTSDRHALVGGYRFEAALCARCHADSQVSPVAAHLPFRIDAGAPHHAGAANGAGECLGCHASSRLDKPFGADFTQRECLRCHLQPQMDAAHAGMGTYRYDGPTCLASGCHQDGTKPTFVDHATIFPIAPGTRHETASCADCHTDPADRKVLGCAGCHPHVEPDTGQAHLLVAGYAPDSALCARCHADAQVFLVATHLPFRIDAAAPHGPLAPSGAGQCLLCHTSSRADKPFGADFAQRDCLGCHQQPQMDPAHLGIPGYAWTTQACLQCHADGTRHGFAAHEAIFPIAAATPHGAATCAQCHVDPADRNVLGCATCHPHDGSATATAHAAVGGFQPDSALCARCHGDAQVTRVATHLPFRIDAGAPHHAGAPGGAGECLGCHASSRADKPFAADFTRHDCIACHARPDMDARHAGMGTYRYDGPTCLASGCHQDGTRPAYVDHATIFPVAPGTVHAIASCDQCHPSPADRRQLGCAGCHPHDAATLATSHALVAGYAFDSALCARCHGDAQVTPVAAHLPFRIDVGAAHRPLAPSGAGECLRCHAAVRADKQFAADFRAQDCLGCHAQAAMDPAHLGIPGYAWATAACLGCHPDGMRHGFPAHEAIFPIAAGTSHATAACTQCHVDPASRAVLGCAGCHPHDAAPLETAHAAVGGYAFDSALCARCHADAQVVPVAAHLPFRLDASAPHHAGAPTGAGECLGCHAASRADKPFGADFAQRDCLRCHLQPQMDAAHAGMGAYRYETPTCLASGCHQDGTRPAFVSHAAIFPIEAGTKHAVATCAQCHPDPGDHMQLGCAGCHPHDATTAAAAHVAVGGFLFESTLCLRCHGDAQVFRVADHQPFRIDGAAPHGPIAPSGAGECLGCHAASRADKPFAADFARQDCLRCHLQPQMDAVHAGMGAYAYATPTCLASGCHADGTRPAFVAHEAIFPIAAGTPHALATCAQCHPDPVDRTRLGCAGCHPHDAATTATAHAAVGGFAFESGLCARCHADAQVFLVAAHLPFRIDAAAPHGPLAPAGGGECLRCHTSARADKPFGTDFTRKDCLGCHLQPDMDAFHLGIPGYGWSTPTCLGCHADGTRQGFPAHEAIFPIAPATLHGAVSCTQCHVDAANRAVLGCAGCHPHDAATLAISHAAVGGYAFDSPLCARCHGDAQVFRVAGHQPFRVDAAAPHGPVAPSGAGDCLGCHASSRADKPFAADFAQRDCLRCHLQPQMDAGHAGIGAYAYATPTCLASGCHADGTKPPFVSHAGIFPIAAGTLHATATCSQCHPNPADRTQLGCAGCHPHDAAPLATAHAAVGGYAFDSALCARCHADAQVFLVAAHLPFRLDVPAPHHAGAPNGAGECLGCHAASRADKPFATDFAQQDCLRCHLQPDMDARHAGIGAYAYATPTCLASGCHADGTRPAFVSHAAIFPIEAGTKHATATCGQCHPDPANRAVLGCAGCHPHDAATTATGHVAVGGFAFQSTLCLRCHGDAQVFPVALHQPFRIDAAAPHGPIAPSGAGECLGCHAASRADKPFAADFAQRDCLRCHLQAQMDTAHAGMGTYRYDTPTCLASGCHEDGTKPAFVPHAAIFPIAAGTLHAVATCAQCHPVAADRTQLGCAGCHPHDAVTLSTGHGAVGGYAFESSLCARCHADAQVFLVAAHLPFRIDAAAPHGPLAPAGGGECLRCHTSARADKPFGTDFAQKDCLACHLQPQMDGFHAGMAGYAWSTPICLECHADGTRQGFPAHETIFPIASTTMHGTTTCAQCHLDPADRAVLGCAGCHPHDADTLSTAHSLVVDYGFASSLCARCHGDAQVFRVADHQPFRIDAAAPHGPLSIGGGACLGCHTAPRIDKPFATDFAQQDCLGCHAQETVDPFHLGMPGYAYDTPTCLASGCHQDGTKPVFVAHDPIFPITGTAVHATARCADCHVDPAYRAVVGCAGCHPHDDATAATAHVLVGGYAFQSALCVACHADSQVNRVADHLPFRIDLAAPHHAGAVGGAGDCLGCHTEIRADKPFGQDFTQKDCLRCHVRTELEPTHLAYPTYQYATPSCLASGCHQDGTKPAQPLGALR